MKPKLMSSTLLAALFASTSTPAFASPILEPEWFESVKGDGPLPTDQAEKIKKALNVEIRRATFNCSWTPSNGPSNQDIGRQFVTVINYETTQVSVNQDRSQPVIRTVSKESSTVEITFNFTTTPDFTRLVKVDASRTSLKSVEKNVGTLLDPKFEEVTERTPILTGSCEIK